MSKILSLKSMVDFSNEAIILALIVRTIYLIKKHIKYILMTDEDKEERKKKKEELKEDLDNQTWQLNAIFPGTREWIYDLIEWIKEHYFLRRVIGYIFCLVPIVNLVVSLIHLKFIFED